MKQFDNMVKGLVRLLGLFIAFGMLSAQADEQNSIIALSASSTGDGTVIIKVDLAQPLANVPAGFTINTPPRIALDFLDRLYERFFPDEMIEQFAVTVSAKRGSFAWIFFREFFNLGE